MISRIEFLKWVNGCVFKGKDGEAPRMFALRHLDADERASPVEEWPYTQSFSIDDFVSEVITTTERDAIGLGHEQRYVVEAYFGNSKVRGRRFTCTMQASSLREDDFGQSEPATSKGEVMQLRRHNENLHRMSVGSAAEMIRILRTENDELRAQVNKLMDRQLSVITTYEDLISQKHKRDMEIEEQKASIEMRNTALKSVLPLGTVIFKRLVEGDQAAKQLTQGTMEAPPAAAEGGAVARELTEVEALVGDVSALVVGDNERAKVVCDAFSDRPDIIARIYAQKVEDAAALMKELPALLVNDAVRAKKIVGAFQDRADIIARIAAFMQQSA